MRIIEVSSTPVRAVAVSPDGRFVAASVDGVLGVFSWMNGEVALRRETSFACTQIAFASDSSWVAPGIPDQPLRLVLLDSGEAIHLMTSLRAAGGVAVSPDGKSLLAPYAGAAKQAKLVRWALPALRPQAGFDDWSPFRRIAFSPNGQYIAGIWPGTSRPRPAPAELELRFTASGGIDYRYQTLYGRAFSTPGFVSFTHDSGMCAFGWEGEFRVLDVSTGTKTGEVRRVESQFNDAAFTGSGRHFATVDEGGLLKLWDVASWQVVREYDWGCGPLTRLAFTTDGTAGVCGTRDGRLVQFDVDE
jgi:WD40 repeat protein